MIPIASRGDKTKQLIDRQIGPGATKRTGIRRHRRASAFPSLHCMIIRLHPLCCTCIRARISLSLPASKYMPYSADGQAFFPATLVSSSCFACLLSLLQMVCTLTKGPMPRQLTPAGRTTTPSNTTRSPRLRWASSSRTPTASSSRVREKRERFGERLKMTEQ